MRSKRRNAIAIVLRVGSLILQMLPQDGAQRRGLTAAKTRVAPRRQKLPLSACDKDLERVGGRRNAEG